MKHASVALAAALLIGSAGMAAAQNNSMSKSPDTSSSMTTGSAMSGGQLNLSSSQEEKLWTDLSADGVKQTAPAGFTAKVGASVPSGITTQPLPSEAANDVPAAKSYHFARVEDQILLVNPADKKIVQIIEQD